MIQPRIMLPPSELGGSVPQLSRVGYIEPGHWGGTVLPTAYNIPLGSSVVSDWIVVSGYNRFMLMTTMAASSSGHLQVTFESLSRTTGTLITNSTANVATLTSVAASQAWLTFGIGTALLSGYVPDIIRLRLSAVFHASGCDMEAGGTLMYTGVS